MKSTWFKNFYAKDKFKPHHYNCIYMYTYVQPKSEKQISNTNKHRLNN